MDKKARLAELIEKVKSLRDLGANITSDQQKDLEAAMVESRTLMGQMKSEQDFEEVEQFAAKAQGVPPLVSPNANETKTNGAGEVRLEEMVPAGAANIETKPTKAGGTMFEAYDERPMMDRKTWELIHQPEYKAAFMEYVRKDPKLISASTYKVLQEGIDTEGGYLVPEDILAAIIQKVPTPTMVVTKVRQLQTMRDVLVIPRVNYTTDNLYTTGIRATWTGEVPASATSARVTDPVFGQTRVPVYTAMMSMPVTNDMIEDSAFPLLSWASDKFAETIDLLKDNMILNGSGIGQPSGILVNPGTVGQPTVTVSGQSASLTADSLESVAFALPPQYDNNAGYIFNKLSTAKSIAQMKDGQGRYLWGAGLQDSGMVPGWKDRRLWGYDVTYSEFMPNIGASTYPVIFGDPTGYYLLNRVGFSIQVLRELYAETNQVLMLGRIRFGGQIAEDWKLKILQCHS